MSSQRRPHYNSALVHPALTFTPSRRSLSTSSSRSSSRSARQSNVYPRPALLCSAVGASSSSHHIPSLPQIPRPKPQRRRKVFDISFHDAKHQLSSSRVPNPSPASAIRGRQAFSNKVQSRLPSSSCDASIRSARKHSLWDYDKDEEDGVSDVIRRTKAWQSLMAAPSAKGNELAPQRYAGFRNGGIELSAITAVDLKAAPVIAVLAATYQSAVGLAPYLVHTASRSQSLSPTSSSASTASSNSSSRTSSPSSSTSTLITDPEASPPSSDQSSVCLSPRCRPRQLEFVPFPSEVDLTVSPRSTYSRKFVPFGRDPLTAPVLNVDFNAAIPSPTSSSKSIDAKHGRGAKLASLFNSALDVLASVGVGRIMLDGYSGSPGMPSRPPLVERDSLGLERSSLSPTSPETPKSLLWSEPVTSSPRARSRSRNHPRRHSLCHSASDPLLYHLHGRAPSIQKRRQAFGPMDVKPYGYRVGSKEVRAAFEEVKEAGLEKETASLWNFMLEADVRVASGGAPRGATSTGVPHSSPKKRQPSPPASSIVALQRYPIIPYNPPGPGVSAEEEVFPKLRNRSASWYLDTDGKIDGEVRLSTDGGSDDGAALFASFPELRRQPSRNASPRARSPSPQRGRARTVRAVSATAARFKTLPPPVSSRVPPLSTKHLRPPPLSDNPSVYLLWALKGSMPACEGKRLPSAASFRRKRAEEAAGVVVRRRVGRDGRVRSGLRWAVEVDEADAQEVGVNDA